MKLHTSGFAVEERGQSGECIHSIFEELWGLSGWCEDKLRGIECKKLSEVA